MGLIAIFGLVCALCLTLLPGSADAAKGKKKGHLLTAMTRNLYLGADLTPLLAASDVNEAIDKGGQVVNQVHATRFPSVRAALLANEIKKKKPDVVGLQEVAWWRTGPVDIAAVSNPSASTTDPLGGDFLSELLAKLNKGKKKGKKGAVSAKKKKAQPLRYRVAVVKEEFDAELPVNDDGQGSGLSGADHNERLTMRDVILVRKGGGVKFSNPSSGTFNTLLRVTVGGAVELDVTRGWTAVDVKARGRTTHVVNTHLEAFDSQASNTANNGQSYQKGGIRQAQAQQLVAPGGPLATSPRTLLIGDLNSDNPVNGDQVFPGDALAYITLTDAGYHERALTPPPFGCCIQDPNLVNPSTVGVDHRVDHLMSNSPKIRFKQGALTSTYASGLWSSDHFGVFSRLTTK
jgi:endonuclease/exonuclease/phosphatase family metal-dependent hydrolase